MDPNRLISLFHNLVNKNNTKIAPCPFLFWLEGKYCNVVLLFAMHQHDSVLSIHVSPPSWTPLLSPPTSPNYCSWILKFFSGQLSPFIPPFSLAGCCRLDSLFFFFFLSSSRLRCVAGQPSGWNTCFLWGDGRGLQMWLWWLCYRRWDLETHGPWWRHPPPLTWWHITHNMWQCHSGNPPKSDCVSLI